MKKQKESLVWKKVKVNLNKETTEQITKVVRANKGAICANCVALSAVFSYLLDDTSSGINKEKNGK